MFKYYRTIFDMDWDAGKETKIWSEITQAELFSYGANSLLYYHLIDRDFFHGFGH